MNGDLEIIDRLCAATTILSDLVRKQAEIIAQSEIADDVMAELAEMKEKADNELDIIEYRLRDKIR